MLTLAQHTEMLRRTGGVVVSREGESTYGHFEEVPVELLSGTEEVLPAQLTSRPSVVIPAGSLTGVGPRKGIGKRVVVGGAVWYIGGIEPADADGGILRLWLGEGPDA